MEVKSHTLSHRAEVFRSKLIEDFQILESLSEQGSKKVPIYTSADITKTGVLDKVLLENPEQMIKLKIYQRDKIKEIDSNVDRRLIRVKNQNNIPLGVWASWVVESRVFQNMLLILIIVNGISIGVEGELPVTNDFGIGILKTLLDFIDSFSVIVFITEIVLKWIDNFRRFWKNPWNIFDFVVTVVSAVPLIIMLLTNARTSQFTVIAKQLAVFRIIRALKMIAQFGSLRIIVLTVLQAFKSLLFIGILLFVVTYIFASAGVILFEAYTMSQRADLQYSRSFSSLVDATITLFQIFTLDQWYVIYNDLIKVIHPVFACTYILLWVWIGAFLFRNLFVGIMVNNFQTITEELARKQENMDQNDELAKLREDLHNELTMHEAKMTNARKSIFVPASSGHSASGHSAGCSTIGSGGGAELRQQISQMMQAEKRISSGWDKIVQSHLMGLSSSPGETLWPRDTLFKYYQVLELLVENLDEYEKLQKLANDCLINLHDSDP